MIAPASSSPKTDAATMLTSPPMLCPTSTGAPGKPAWAIKARISSAHTRRGYSSRRSLSPWPLRSGAITS
jgi:hypothetical protein